MNVPVLILFFVMLGSIGSVAGAALLLLFPERVREILMPGLISYATGTLLGAAFLGMIPHGLEYIEPFRTLATVLAGIILFFLLEKLVIWRHCHDGECQIHSVAGPLILFGDAFPMADLIPELHKRFGVRTTVRQFLLFISGIGTILIFRLNH